MNTFEVTLPLARQAVKDAPHLLKLTWQLVKAQAHAAKLYSWFKGALKIL